MWSYISVPISFMPKKKNADCSKLKRSLHVVVTAHSPQSKIMSLQLV